MSVRKVQTISNQLLADLGRFIESRLGLDFPQSRRGELEKSIANASEEFGFADKEDCVRWLLSSPMNKERLEILASHLTVGETYFFRDAEMFKVLEKEVLADLIQSRQGRNQSLRIWCAGCCTGEEPYSIAILLCNLIADIGNWQITILGSDVNRRFLEKAIDGIYKEWSFRGTPDWVKAGYFTRTRDGWLQIQENIRKIVTFSYHNLAEDPYPSLVNNTNAMDLIFCRNVLMYFSQEKTKRAVENLYRCLVDGGWLFVSPSEVSHLPYSKFATIYFPGVILLRKESQAPPPQIGLKVIVPPSVEQPRSPVHPELKPSKTVPAQLHFAAQVPEQLPDKSMRRGQQQAPPVDLYDVALRLYEQGRYEEAGERLLEEVSQDRFTRPELFKALILLARIFANKGKLSDALECCTRAIAMDKLDPAIHFLHATILQERGELEQASAALRRSLYLDQDFVIAHFAMGNLLHKQGRFVESHRHFKIAMMLLGRYEAEQILPESEGLTAGRLSEIIESIRKGADA